MTTLDLEPIKERLAAATPGSWRVWHDPDPSKVRATATLKEGCTVVIAVVCFLAFIVWIVWPEREKATKSRTPYGQMGAEVRFYDNNSLSRKLYDAVGRG